MSENTALRSLPSIEKLVASPRLAAFESRLAHPIRVRLAQEWIAELREKSRAGGGVVPELPEIERGLERRFEALASLGMRKVINATGVLLHTNLGRAPLGGEALAELARELDGYCTLEFDLGRGERGTRGAAVERLLQIVCETPAALVVNNCAAALFLILHRLAPGREVLLSRGELVQIGGGFRLPDILAASGARLKEVGTTNITLARDYREALGEATGLLLKVHQSCFVLHGHVESPKLEELAAIAKNAGIPFVVDLGSGQLVDSEVDELRVDAVQRAGANLVCFSGDKLLGGPQAGIVVGDRALIETLKASPLYRALRLGKTELFLLEKTLQGYAAGRLTPTQERIAETAEVLRARAQRLLEWLLPLAPGSLLREGLSSIGGGTPPSNQLATWLVELGGGEGETIARRLLRAPVPIVARRENKRLSLDLRTVFPAEDAMLRDGLRLALSGSSERSGED